jgi:hypothetical protein
MDTILTASAITVIAFVFSYILTDEGEIMAWYYRLILRLPDWLFKPLGGCGRCLAGQIGLWYGFTLDWRSHIVLVFLSILLTDIILKVYERAENG